MVATPRIRYQSSNLKKALQSRNVERDIAVIYLHLKIVSLSMRKLQTFDMPKSEVLDATEKVKPVHAKYSYVCSVDKMLRRSAKKSRTQACRSCEEMFIGKGLRASREDTGESCGSVQITLSHICGYWKILLYTRTELDREAPRT
jgi:hypothetical protein